MRFKSLSGVRRLLVVVPLAFLVAACLPEGIKVPQSEFSGLLERKVGLLAYLATDGNIYTVDQGGNNQVQITTDAYSDSSGYRLYGMPTWSPNGQSVAFVSYTGPKGEPPVGMSLFTAKKDGSSLVEARKNGDLIVYWSWSPDNERVGYISQTPNAGLALQVVPSGGGDSQVVDAGSPYYWSWAPDSDSVLAHAGGASPNASARLSLLKLDANVIEQAIDIRPSEFKAPAFSPNGKQVLVAGVTADDKQALLVAGANGSDPRIIAEYEGAIAFAWSPNSKRVAYLVSPSPELGTPGKLVVVDPAGKNKKQIELADDEVYAFFWSPDSKSLAYFIRKPVTEATPTPDASSADANAAADGSDQAFAVTLKVMDAGNGKAHTVANFVPTERFLQVIPYFDQYQQALTIWSPDSKNLVVSAYRNDGTPSIWVVAASGRLDPRYIADGWTAFWSWR